MKKIAHAQYLAHPDAEEGEEFGVEYVVLDTTHAGDLVVAARFVGEVQNGDWDVYTVQDPTELFDAPGLAAYFPPTRR